MICPSCGCDQAAEARFCEDCGWPMNAPVVGSVRPAETAGGDVPGAADADLSACSSCGAGPGAIAADGFCNHCGQQRIDASRNHLEIAVSPQLAGVTDIGLKHFRNEDALGLCNGPDTAAMVVCDGVSHSQNPDLASVRAASAALAALRGAVANPSGNHVHDLVTVALQAAQTAVRSIPLVDSSPEDPPESTIILALRRGPDVSLGWLGDSRAYLITPDDARQCSTDHSWLNEVVASGKMTLAEALASPLAHALTRSLGGPASSSDEPSQCDFELPAGPSWLVLCSDGLWNYVADAASLAVLIRSQPAEADALACARALVEFARQRGGHDNITAAVLRCETGVPDG